MGSKKYNVAVLGATGMVGKVMMKELEQRKFPVTMASVVLLLQVSLQLVISFVLQWYFPFDFFLPVGLLIPYLPFLQ